ncbi:MAG: helix-turn-helix domain-containing protein [Pseudotabrizicola sp.]|uniref:TetR/AcrR family transcriptional regulator n=1 Tax=Pseudotabrizicola sp. TaxID=2939647 RepID=UPI00271B8D52|nr:TetR/AcrR family transcriptional regulator [Pseudotabrizicola sp.]MDO8883579.1 helix-turn-helix domain-containing protein [Pseudotabrizicola sp.]MDP2081232.1 helix-turn-helix domain-containing protein [Pseudotabrizicola sp.]MDZ7576149.1 helix-turn-helix domain-containing protein [Pseudotabrizicola sp.]
MAVVSPVPLADQRSAEILDSARRAFAEKGFDGASMQDIARQAGMSVGNFYRYFPSKSAIVEALIALDMAEMEQDFATILAHPNPILALRETIERKITEADCQGDGQIWAEITAASLRKPEIGDATLRMEVGIVAHLTTIFALAAGVAKEEAQTRWTAHAHLIVMLVKACAMQHPDNPITADLTRLVMRNINQTLDDIATSAALKG